MSGRKDRTGEATLNFKRKEGQIQWDTAYRLQTR